MLKALKIILVPVSISIAGLTVNVAVLNNKTNLIPTQITDTFVAKTSTANLSKGSIDLSSVNTGLVKVSFPNTDNSKIKVEIKKENASYMYDLASTDSYDSFPLQLGSGKYTVTLFKNVSGSDYSTVNTWTFDASIDENKVYLNSIELVNWNASSKAVALAKELTVNCKTNDEKVTAIYNYVVNSIKYDSNKLAKLPSNYLPNIDSTLSTKNGICYDFSALMASMLRSVGIQTKLVMGTTPNIQGYHAWNQIYLDSVKGFVTVDTSYDAQAIEAKLSPKMAKDFSLYHGDKQY